MAKESNPLSYEEWKALVNGLVSRSHDSTSLKVREVMNFLVEKNKFSVMQQFYEYTKNFRQYVEENFPEFDDDSIDIVVLSALGFSASKYARSREEVFPDAPIVAVAHVCIGLSKKFEQ